MVLTPVSASGGTCGARQETLGRHAATAAGAPAARLVALLPERQQIVGPAADGALQWIAIVGQRFWLGRDGSQHQFDLVERGVHDAQHLLGQPARALFPGRGFLLRRVIVRIHSGKLLFVARLLPVILWCEAAMPPSLEG
jgi:hypothetical protein